MGPPPGPEPRRTNPAVWIIPIAAVALILVVALIIGILVASSDDEKDTATGAGGGELVLQPISEPGPDPFGPSVGGGSPTSTVPPDLPIVINPPQTAPRFTPGSGPGIATGSVTATSISGGTPGLYGGTRNQSSCNKQQMIDFLLANQDKARAWARVQGIDVGNLQTYINELTPVLLRSDTRVTNHGFRGGEPYPIQSVLQAGTAVLVDKFGLPRARCACGNPLVSPVPLSGPPTYRGPPWTGFNPGNVTIINNSTTVINIITIIDVTTGTPFGRTPGGPDVPLPPGGSTTTSGATTTRPGGTTTTLGAPGSSWRLREIKIDKNPGSSQPNIQTVRQPSASGGELLVTVPDSGLCGGPGTGTTRLSWTIGRDVTVVRNGDPPIPATVTASGAGSTGACNAGFTARTFLTVSGSDGDGSVPASAFNRPVDQGRFGGGTPRGAPAPETAAAGTANGSVAVGAGASDPGRPLAWFAAKVEGPGILFYVLYIYELV